jgi:soluble lytic murein transglycosylase
MELYDQNLTLVIAAYNAGSGNVKRWQKGLGSLPKDEFIESIPFKETREYVKKVVTAMELYQRLYRAPAEKNQAPENRQAVQGAEDKSS